MKIGYFTSIRGWGGSETYLLDLMKGVRERGHDVLLFGVAGTRLWEVAGTIGIERVAWHSIETSDVRRQTEDHRAQDENVRPKTLKIEKPRTRTVKANWLVTDFHSLKPKLYSLISYTKQPLLRCMPSALKLLAGNLCEVVLLRRLFKAHLVDVMHVSNSGYEVAGLACRFVGIPSLVMNMITPPEDESWIRRQLMIFTTRKYNHVSSQSAYCTGQWVKLAGIPKGRTSFVWNGVDVKRFLPAPDRKQNKIFKLVSLGRLHKMKGFCYLIDAMTLLPGCELKIYGDGEERGALERQIAGLCLENRVFLPGHTEFPETVLQAADCFVLPSVSHESCPAVLAQAMACGLPLVTSDFGPLSEVNLTGSTGFVCAMRDPVALATAIMELKRDLNRYNEMRKAALLRSTELSVDRMINQTINLYRTMMV
jgi:glycosyltransferase involved in cell wall biosynthesis